MKKQGKLVLHRESLRNLDAVEVKGGYVQSIGVGCTSEYTWRCPSAQTDCTDCN
jgi:hypothetical protein